MKTVTIAGLPYVAWSPSLFSMELAEGRITICFNGSRWCVATNDVYGPRQFASREEAGQLVADCIQGISWPVEVS
jgi:hypothetical protein